MKSIIVLAIFIACGIIAGNVTAQEPELIIRQFSLGKYVELIETQAITAPAWQFGDSSHLLITVITDGKQIKTINQDDIYAIFAMPIKSIIEKVIPGPTSLADIKAAGGRLLATGSPAIDPSEGVVVYHKQTDHNHAAPGSSGNDWQYVFKIDGSN